MAADPERGPRVALIGAGMSGLCLAMLLRRAGHRNFRVFERASSIGGTWRDNDYPGSGCDVPSRLYSFSFEPNPDWSRKFSQQPEILGYMERCVEKYGLEEHLVFDSELLSARFDEHHGHWTLHFADGRREIAEVLVSCCGQLARPSIPEIEGLDRFEGVTFHSARWDHEVDLRGLRVGVLGNGASAIQFVPEIAPLVEQLTIFQRSANWIVPKPDRAYRPWERRLFRWLPVLGGLQRFLQFLTLETRFPAFRQGTWTGRRFQRLAKRSMEQQVRDRTVLAGQMPDYPIGCKRVLISNDYLPTLERANVEVVREPIVRFDASGAETAGGRRHELDAVVFATGFRSTEFLAPMEIEGLDGRSLNQVWRRGAEAYLGMTVSGFPNFFMLYGPNTNLGHNSVLLMIECQARYVTECVEVLDQRNLLYMDLESEAQRRFNERLRRDLDRSVWATDCSSWYKNADGRITNNWSGTTFEYRRRTLRPNLAHYRLVARDDGEATLTPAAVASA